ARLLPSPPPGCAVGWPASTAMLARRAGGEAVFDAEMLGVPPRARAGGLPAEARGAALVGGGHPRYAASQDGTVADYIPILGEADPRLFGLSLTEVDGTVHHAGDADVAFSVQSISKAFVLALVCESIGHEQVHRTVGVNNTGLPF